MPVEVGLSNEMEITVPESDTARATGGESLPPVFSTPRLISYLERTAHYAILPFLAVDQTSVGMSVTIRHLAATPVGMQVRFRVEVIEIDRRRLRFKIEAFDEVEKIAEGEHERFIVDNARFFERLAEKQRKMNG